MTNGMLVSALLNLFLGAVWVGAYASGGDPWFLGCAVFNIGMFFMLIADGQRR